MQPTVASVPTRMRRTPAWPGLPPVRSRTTQVTTPAMKSKPTVMISGANGR
jgi:hypothetical protein